MVNMYELHVDLGILSFYRSEIDRHGLEGLQVNINGNTRSIPHGIWRTCLPMHKLIQKNLIFFLFILLVY